MPDLVTIYSGVEIQYYLIGYYMKNKKIKVNTFIITEFAYSSRKESLKYTEVYDTTCRMQKCRIQKRYKIAGALEADSLETFFLQKKVFLVFSCRSSLFTTVSNIPKVRFLLKSLPKLQQILRNQFQ